MKEKDSICYFCGKIILDEHEEFQGLHPACFMKWFGVNEIRDFVDIYARNSEKNTDEWAHVTSSFFHGKFRKYSARLFEKNFLLKVQQAEFPELPGTEYLCNQLARFMQLSVPDFYYLRFQNELDTFVCKNFMQDFPGGNLIHIYRFLQKPEDYSCQGLLNVLEKEVKRIHDIHRFIHLTLFDALIGNHDRHGRNLALIQVSKGTVLSPFYDNPSYLAMEDDVLLGAHHEPRGAIATSETRDPTMRDYVKEWIKLGYIDIVNDFIKKVDLNAIKKIVDASFVSAKRKQAFMKLIIRRYEELCDAS